MNVSPIKYNTQIPTRKPAFGHGNFWSESTYSTKEKSIIAASSAIGVLAGLAILAKGAKYSLNPKKMFKNFKGSYMYKAPYDEKEIITMGAGSCIGGLAAGCALDKDKNNRKAKLQETLLQIANVSVPIIFVTRFAKGGQKFGKKFLEKNANKETFRTKIPQAIGGTIGLFSGVWASNILANKINEKIFNKGKGRPVKLSDFSAHVDDFCSAARQFNKESKLIQNITRCIPAILIIPGFEVGNKKA